MENKKWTNGIKVYAKRQEIYFKNPLISVNQVQKPNPHVQVHQKPVLGNHNLRPTPA
jgi:hypothetical protein